MVFHSWDFLSTNSVHTLSSGMKNHAHIEVKNAKPPQMYPSPAPISERRYGVTNTTTKPTITLTAVCQAHQSLKVAVPEGATGTNRQCHSLFSQCLRSYLCSGDICTRAKRHVQNTRIHLHTRNNTITLVDVGTSLPTERTDSYQECALRPAAVKDESTPAKHVQKGHCHDCCHDGGCVVDDLWIVLVHNES